MPDLKVNDDPNKYAIVIDCPVCHRTIWNGTVCHHGEIKLTPVKGTSDQDDPALSESSPRKRPK